LFCFFRFLPWRGDGGTAADNSRTGGEKDEKVPVLAVTAAMLLWPTDTGAAAAAYKGDVPPFCASSVQETKEELYRQLFITLLFPHVEKAIRDYYDEYMKYLPGEAPGRMTLPV
jgi:hypothetical protein